MTSIPSQHRGLAPREMRCAVLTVSDTRTLQDDRGGDSIVSFLADAGHALAAREICRDDEEQISDQIRNWQVELDPHVILVTGGTGISPRDHTYETLLKLLTKHLPGYGELFRWLSFDEIGPAAMLSRSVGGLIDTTVILSMPGSPAAIRLAMERLILPELGHLVQQARKDEMR